MNAKEEKRELNQEEKSWLKLGKRSEVELCKFYDEMVSCDVDMSNGQWKFSKPNLDNLPMKIRKVSLDQNGWKINTAI